MSNVVIGGTASGATPLPVAGSIDPINDLIPIYTNSLTATQAISRNTYLGVTGQPADLTSTQTLQNKTLNNTNTATLKDTLLTLQNTSDTTKQAKFQLSGITTGNTRTYTLPDVTDTLVSLTATQTLTNKTLTSSTINSPTITNASLTADSITGYTTSNTGSIYGVAVTAGVITGSASIGSAALATNAVQGNQLSANAITLGYAQITTAATTTSSSYGLVTGLSASVTIPSGGRKVKITFNANYFTISAAGTVAISIWDGTVGSGTQLSEVTTTLGGSGTNIPCTTIAVVSPSAGSKTYNIGFKTSTGTGTMAAASTAPAFILVEAI